MTVLIGIAFKSLLIAALTLGLLELMKRRSAAERSWIAHAGLFALVLMAVAPLALPNWNVEGPALLGKATVAEVPAETTPAPLPVAKDGKLNVQELALSTVAPKTTPTQPAAAKPAPLSVTATTMVLYAVPAAILLFITFLALARLVTLRARADVLVDGHWLSALARAQRRMGFKHGTALLTSDELASPISWGLMRPVIVLNTRAVEAQGEAEAIIAHELAHVARMDWIKLLLARVATALFWFNPLVWLLAREAHQLREEAADDAVLAADITDTDYAELLVGVARHECPGLLLGAHGVAPSKNSLARRVARVLDGKIVRGPVAGPFAAGVFVGAVVIAAPLAALTLVPRGTSEAKKAVSAAATAPGKKAAVIAPYYPETAPTDLPSIISQGVQTSVKSAVSAIGPAVGSATDYQAVAPSGATVTNTNGITVARAPNGATTTIYPPDASGRRRVVMKSQTGSILTFADASEVAGVGQVRYKDKQDKLIDKAIQMKAVGVDAEYVAEIRAVAPQLRNLTADDFIELKAVGVSSEYIRDLARAGYAHLDKNSLVQAAALDLDAEYIRGLASVGYPNLSLNQYSQLKAVEVTPEYIRDLRRSGYGPFTVDKLVQMRALGIDFDDLRAPPVPPVPPHAPIARVPSH
jgi:beta-lactamase regulating signal transducer with metallopeptidase domain